MPARRKDWKVAVGPEPVPLIVEVINAHMVWGWLSKRGRAAFLAAKDGGVAAGHPLTLRSLRRHGLIADDNRLTAAGAVIAKWNPPPKPERPEVPATNPTNKE